LIAFSTDFRHSASAIFATPARSAHAFSSASAARRRDASIRRKGGKTASGGELLPALGRPIAMHPMTGGSAQPRYGVTHRALPMTLRATLSNAPMT
jgi:hypothetical protein